MSRRGQISKRDVLPDPLYNSELVTKLINNIMFDGKKGVAQKIVYDAFKVVEEKLGQNPLDVFKRLSITLCRFWRLRPSRRRRQLPGASGSESGKTPDPRSALAHRILALQKRENMAERLAAEIMDAKTARAEPSRRRKKSIRWRKRIRHSHITDTDFPAPQGAIRVFPTPERSLITNAKGIFT